MKRGTKNYFKRILRKGFELMQRAKVNVLPIHFYSQIPVIHELKKDLYWKKPYSLHKIYGTEIPEQVKFVSNYMNDLIIANLVKMNIHENAIFANGEDSGFGFVESDFLYAFIINEKPSRIIQVGCGVATAVILLASSSANYKPEIICVEPFPTSYLINLEKNGIITLIREKAQKVDISSLTNLGPGDLFFLDSTHTVKPGSEVNKVILEVFPRLSKDVWVHIHDIFFPYDYTREILTSELFFWSESVLLQAFLTQNESFSIQASFSMLHYYQPIFLMKCFPLYDPQGNDSGLRTAQGKHFPSSLYLKVIK